MRYPAPGKGRIVPGTPIHELMGVLPKSERMGDGCIMFTAEPPRTPSFAEVVMKLRGNSAFFAARR